ncbi:MAG TPA: HemK2/MTQ2 family protein methyltransferase [Thermoleophilaceae bacterium]|nr:HemK2/MTQ2 family protein methyltransferase [Thermoleophilaceae bacterium]
MRIVAPPGVFRPRSDSWMLADAAREQLRPGASVLDLCTGSGAVAVAAALAGAERVTAVDLSRRAVATARVNAFLNGTGLRAVRGSLFEPLGDERFDLIVSNPPYVPAEDAGPPRGQARAWDAGHDGRELLDPLLARAPAHLSPGGALLVVHSSITGEQITLDAMRAGGLEPAVVRRERSPLGPLHGSRAELLERRGLLEPGQREEEVMVIRGTAPL